MEERIIVKNLEEDFYDGQVLQKLLGDEQSCVSARTLMAMDCYRCRCRRACIEGICLQLKTVLVEFCGSFHNVLHYIIVECKDPIDGSHFV